MGVCPAVGSVERHFGFELETVAVVAEVLAQVDMGTAGVPDGLELISDCPQEDLD